MNQHSAFTHSILISTYIHNWTVLWLQSSFDNVLFVAFTCFRLLSLAPTGRNVQSNYPQGRFHFFCCVTCQTDVSLDSSKLKAKWEAFFLFTIFHHWNISMALHYSHFGFILCHFHSTGQCIKALFCAMKLIFFFFIMHKTLCTVCVLFVKYILGLYHVNL